MVSMQNSTPIQTMQRDREIKHLFSYCCWAIIHHNACKYFFQRIVYCGSLTGKDIYDSRSWHVVCIIARQLSCIAVHNGCCRADTLTSLKKNLNRRATQERSFAPSTNHSSCLSVSSRASTCCCNKNKMLEQISLANAL